MLTHFCWSCCSSTKRDVFDLGPGRRGKEVVTALVVKFLGSTLDGGNFDLVLLLLLMRLLKGLPESLLLPLLLLSSLSSQSLPD